jgi:ribosome biogenesis ATPase
MSSKLKLSGDFDFKALARATPGYVGADLNALVAEAGMCAVKRIFNKMREEALKNRLESDMDIDKLGPSDIRGFLEAFPETLSEDELQYIAIRNEDFHIALGKVQPSCKREGFATVPDVSWDDIGALSTIREELRMAVVEPIQHPEYFEKVGISSPAGVLLWGPPGCGKTLLAKAVANASHSNFISVKGPELLNKVW